MPSDEQALLEAYRARQQPEHLLRNLEKMRRNGQVSDDTYASLRQEYLSAIDSANDEIARHRDAFSHELLHTREEVISRLHERERLDSRYQSGELNKSAYQKALKAIDGELAALDARCKHLEGILAAETASQLEHVLAPVRLKGRTPPQKTARPSEGASHARPRPPAKLLLVGLLAVAFVAVGLWGVPQLTRLLPSADTSDGDAVPQASMVTGERVDVVPQQVAQPGETLSVSGTGTPLDGVSIELPPEAYAAPVTFDIGYSPIEELDAGDGVQAITPLIHVDTHSDNYAEDLIALSVPVEVPDGHFAMAFIYDEVLGLLHPLPTIEETDGTLTAFTRHFCPVLVLCSPFDRFLSESVGHPGSLDAVKQETGFLPGRDTWNLVNAGSSIAPGGYCKGMSLSSLYHFLVERKITGESLWKDEYDNGLPEGMGTPGFWQDDRWAIELCSAVNRLGEKSSAGPVMDALKARVEGLTPERKLKALEQQFYLTAFALYVTKSPQLLDIRSSAGDGHSLLCYQIEGSTLLIADPNYPNTKDIPIQFADGKLGPYSAPQNSKDAKEGKNRTYDRIYYQGDISFFDVKRLEHLWTEYEAGSLNAGFPQYAIKTTELNEEGTPLRTYELDRDLSNRSATNRLRFELDAAFEGRMTVYEYGSPPKAVSGNEVTLEEGDNYIGFLVEEKKGDRWEWAGFDWIHVYMPRAGEKSENYICFITVEYDCVPITEGRRAEGLFPSSVETRAYGRLTGDTFTADWLEKDEWGSWAGHIVVRLSPDRELVTDFEFWEESESYSTGHRDRMGASGAGIEMVWYCDPSEGVYTYAGYTEGGMAPVEVIWENPPHGQEEHQNFYVDISLGPCEPADDAIPRG